MPRKQGTLAFFMQYGQVGEVYYSSKTDKDITSIQHYYGARLTTKRVISIEDDTVVKLTRITLMGKRKRKSVRQPKYMGSGIHVHQQFSASTLVKGDTFFDADFGNMQWNGKKWVSIYP